MRNRLVVLGLLGVSVAASVYTFSWGNRAKEEPRGSVQFSTSLNSLMNNDIDIDELRSTTTDPGLANEYSIISSGCSAWFDAVASDVDRIQSTYGARLISEIEKSKDFLKKKDPGAFWAMKA